MAQVVDYSYGRVGGTNISHARAVAEAGFVGAIRYLCWPDGSIKQITRAELEALWAFNLSVGFVWETTADRASRGFAAGHADAVEANHQMSALGVPGHVPIYYAVDFDARPEQVRSYFEGALSVASGAPVGVYGSYRVIEGLADLTDWLWQCAAWSGNGSGTGGSIQGRRLSEHAVLFQRVGYVLGETCDVNDVLAPDWGGYHPGQQEEVVALTLGELQKELVNQDTRTKAALEAMFAKQLEDIQAEFVHQDTRTKAYLETKLP